MIQVKRAILKQVNIYININFTSENGDYVKFEHSKT